jgi:hypothetical protein
MKSDCNRLVEQSEKNQSVDVNFNRVVGRVDCGKGNEGY